MQTEIEEEEPLSRFTNDPGPFLERLRVSGQPLLLTVEGKGEVVVQDAASYQRFLAMAERTEMLASIREGLQDIAEGRSVPARAALEEIGRMLNLPPVLDD